MGFGRPQKIRLSGTGEKLQAALQIVGLTWSSTNVSSTNHVLNNRRWKRCGLPRSINTLMNDIRSGIPAERLDAYSSFFSINADMLLNTGVSPYSSEFSCEILKCKHKIFSVNTMPLHSEDPHFCHLLTQYNDESFLNTLYAALRGLYVLYLREESDQTIFMAAIHVHSTDKNHILGTGYLKLHGIDINLRCRIFRWASFLHINYLSEDYHVLGYMMACDPTASMASARREPLNLPLFGLAGSVSSLRIPDRFHGYAEKIPIPDGELSSSAYTSLCEQIHSNPYIDSQNPMHADVYNKISVVRHTPQHFHTR
jgi:hypothetical protein